jgi:hypothetical protein
MPFGEPEQISRQPSRVASIPDHCRHAIWFLRHEKPQVSLCPGPAPVPCWRGRAEGFAGRLDDLRRCYDQYLAFSGDSQDKAAKSSEFVEFLLSTQFETTGS